MRGDLLQADHSLQKTIEHIAKRVIAVLAAVTATFPR